MDDGFRIPTWVVTIVLILILGFVLVVALGVSPPWQDPGSGGQNIPVHT